MTQVRVFDDAEAVAQHAADVICEAVDDARHDGRELHIALAGGGSPKRAYELLAGVEGSWKHVHLWLGDERCVPLDHEDSNARMIRESLFAGERDEQAQLHVLPSPEQPEDAAWLYAQQFLAAVPDATLDIVLLGMGPDGHTASLFPGFPQLASREAPVVAVRDSPKPPPARVTFTLPVLQRARFTLLLVTGPEKADALAKLRAGDESVPVALLGDGLDEVACDAEAAGGA